ncbi:hypothetical protein H9P43_006111 [Blastocladiella emersonii ATCC 22665]|nr:hypothetical protein H9P43_006111 [Blastocladiella emersonii ATCC 22665]
MVNETPASPRYPWGKYPAVRRDESCVETLHGVPVADPYRWLEDPDSDETKQFVEDQATLTEAYLAQYPDKAKFEAKLTDMFNYERFSVPSKHGDAYYYWYNSGLLNQSVLYRQATLDAEPEIFFDPNKLSDDGTVALSTYSFSEKATYFGYAISKSGSDWVSIHVKRVADGEDLDDVVHFAKFTSIEWTKDEAGFFYTRYPKVDAADLGTETDANYFAQTMYHALGTAQVDDVLVYHDPEHPTYAGGVTESDCGHYLILAVSASTAAKNLLWIAPHPAAGEGYGALAWARVVDDIDVGSFQYITNEGSVFYFLSNAGAPKQRVVTYDLANPSAGFVDLVAEDAECPLTSAAVVDGDKLVLVYMRDVKDTVCLHSLATGERLDTIALPPASISGLSAKKKQSDFFFSYTSFLSPGTIVRYDVPTRTASEFKRVSVAGFNPDEFVAEQEFYTGKYGTKIPMFIVHCKGLKLDGSNPTFLYGYMGFNISIGPAFSPAWITFMAHYNGVVVVANGRGGGEYGEEWHEAGTKAQKQNVFDDFQWAARHLVARRYTSHKKIAINGGSNGGLLVGACVNQAPELFGAAVAEVGVMDMLRFHKFTIGHAWIADYGNPDIAEEFAYIRKYSPVHNTTTQDYPATLIMTSDHDDRVVPLHSYKFAAALQHANPNSKNPLLILIERKAGHGAGKPTKKRIESAALKFAFITMNIGAQWHE